MGFFKSFVNDQDKTLNPIHVIMAFMVVNAVGWVWYLILKNRVMPALDGIAMLLGGGGVANLAQQADNIISKFKKHPDPDSDVPVVLKKIENQ